MLFMPMANLFLWLAILHGPYHSEQQLTMWKYMQPTGWKKDSTRRFLWAFSPICMPKGPMQGILFWVLPEALKIFMKDIWTNLTPVISSTSIRWCKYWLIMVSSPSISLFFTVSDGRDDYLPSWAGGDSSRCFHYNRSYQDEPWLDFQWAQTGHDGLHLYHKVERMYDNKPVKACLNGEPTLVLRAIRD